MFLYIFSYSTTKVQSIETQQPIAMPQCLSVVARTNESQVGFLTYRNEMLNFFIAIFWNKYMLYYLFSYSTPKLQSIEAQQPFPIPKWLSIVARTNESHVGFLTYMNNRFNLFIAVFPNQYMFLYIFSSKFRRLRHSKPSPCPNVYL